MELSLTELPKYMVSESDGTACDVLYQTQLWLRWWDEQGELLLIGDERAELAEQAQQQAEQARQAEAQARREAIPRLLELGLSVEQVAATLSFSVEEVRRFAQ